MYLTVRLASAIIFVGRKMLLSAKFLDALSKIPHQLSTNWSVSMFYITAADKDSKSSSSSGFLKLFPSIWRHSIGSFEFFWICKTLWDMSKTMMIYLQVEFKQVKLLAFTSLALLLDEAF